MPSHPALPPLLPTNKYKFVKTFRYNNKSIIKGTRKVVPVEESPYIGRKYKIPGVIVEMVGLTTTKKPVIRGFYIPIENKQAGGPINGPSHKEGGVACTVEDGAGIPIKEIEIEGKEYHLGEVVISDPEKRWHMGTPTYIFNKMIYEHGNPQAITPGQCILYAGSVIITKPAVESNDVLVVEGTNLDVASAINSYYGGVEFSENKCPIYRQYTTKEIAAKHNISASSVKNRLREGALHELEHTPNKEIATAIASHHLMDNINYYNTDSAECGCHIKKEIAAKGLINKRMKFPKNLTSQSGKYGGGSEPNPEPKPKTKTGKTAYEINKEIEAIINAKGDNPNAYSVEEKTLLTQYTGYGGIQDQEQTLEEVKAGFTEFYTPDSIVKKMWALAYKHGYKGGPVLEPSVGIGNFIKYVPAGTLVTGYMVVDGVTGKITETGGKPMPTERDYENMNGAAPTPYQASIEGLEVLLELAETPEQAQNIKNSIAGLQVLMELS